MLPGGAERTEGSFPNPSTRDVLRFAFRPIADPLRARLNSLIPKVSKSPEPSQTVPPVPLEPEKISEEPIEVVGVTEVDENLEHALATGPSSLIGRAVLDRLQALARTDAGKVSLKAFLTNPAAALEVLRAGAQEVSAYASVRTTIAGVTKWAAEVAADDARRDVLLEHVDQLEKDLGEHIDSFCQRNRLPVPDEGTLERATLLLRINVELAALQTRAEAIRQAGERLVGEQVEIQVETARRQMLARELPFNIAASKEVNALQEASLAERVRHYASLAGIGLSSLVVGAVGGLYSGLEKTVSILVEKYPEVAIPLGAGAGMFVLQLVTYSGPLSGEILKAFALKGGLVSGMAAVGVGIGVGLVKWASREDSQTPEVNAQH